MLARARSHRQRKLQVHKEQLENQAEVAKLRTKIARLENALAQAIASSETVVDLRTYEEDLDVLAAQPVECFAAAWTKSDTAWEDAIGERFFTSGHVDQRARSWLLTTK